MTSAGHHHGAGVTLRERSQQAQGIIFFFNGKGYRDTWKYKKSGDDATCSEFPESSVDIYLLAISGERPSVAFGQEDAFCLP